MSKRSFLDVLFEDGDDEYDRGSIVFGGENLNLASPNKGKNASPVRTKIPPRAF